MQKTKIICAINPSGKSPTAILQGPDFSKIRVVGIKAPGRIKNKKDSS